MSDTSRSGDYAIGGFDAVAYFEEGSPVAGHTDHSVDHRGATWLFATEGHARDFADAPERYVPAYLGRCAFAMSLGKSEEGDPRRWAIQGGRLFLNSNGIAHLLWKVIPGRIRAADKHWKERGPAGSP